MNRYMPMACSIALLFAAAAGHAQTMYKCKGPDGTTIFSQQSCPDDAQQVTARPTSGAAAAGQAFERTAALAAISHRETQCVQHANALAHNEADLRIRQHSDRLGYLQGRIDAGNVSDAAQKERMRGEIATLQQQIAAEKAQAEAAFAAGRQRCADDRLRAEQALDAGSVSG
jgi:hypothetical protein